MEAIKKLKFSAKWFLMLHVLSVQFSYNFFSVNIKWTDFTEEFALEVKFNLQHDYIEKVGWFHNNFNVYQVNFASPRG